MSLLWVVCDDDEFVRHAVAAKARARGDEVLDAEDGEAALGLLQKESVDVLLLDLHMPGTSGLETLTRMLDLDDPPPVVVMTSQGQLETALEASKRGARAYLTKPINFDELFMQVDGIVEQRRVARELDVYRQARNSYAKLIGAAAAMQPVFALLRQLEDVAAPTVLIQGESGTGKDLIAQAIHSMSTRREQPFMEVDCAALPEALIESELFGHEKGAFTDAQKAKPGLFEVAERGTLFLDEIGEMPLGTQAKFLRALESRAFKRVGGVRALSLDAAIVAATNRDLEKEVRNGRFREDLYFRLKVIPVVVPSLRDRKEDVPALAEHFLQRFCRELGRHYEGISDEALEVLSRYRWPGNVRELRNVLERVAILERGEGPLRPSQLPPEVRFAPVEGDGETDAVDVTAASGSFVLPEAGINLEELEHNLLLQALERTGGQRTRAAALLGITRHALRYRLQKSGIDDSET